MHSSINHVWTKEVLPIDHEQEVASFLKKRLGYRILTFNIKQNSIIFFPLKDLSLCCHISIKMMIDVSSNEKTRSSSGQSISRFRWCIIEKTVAEKCHFFNTSNLFWQKSLITSTSLCLIWRINGLNYWKKTNIWN